MNEAELTAGLPETPNYRYAELVGDQLFVAGQVPHDARGRLVGPEDSRAQAKRCLDNLELLLLVHGFERSHIRQIVIYVVGNQTELAGAWGAIVDWFGRDVPPATLLGVAALGHPGQIVEIDATVIKS